MKRRGRRCGSGLLAMTLCLGCGTSSAPTPFGAERDGGTGRPDGGTGFEGSAPEPLPDPTLGGPCSEDGDCDDGLSCTFDRCDPELLRCRFSPDHSKCADDVFCNGVELCENGLGCRPGEPLSCSDGLTCTIDSCNEEMRLCEHVLRDADGDGDPDINCEGGGDCDERDPRISSLSPEICDNGRDDNCDGRIDELPCEAPAYDDCTDPLEVTASGAFELRGAALANDYAASCAPDEPGLRDLVVALVVPEGQPMQADVVVTAAGGTVGLVATEQCGESGAEVHCENGVRTEARTSVARLLWRDLLPGAHALYVFTDRDGPLLLEVDYAPSQPPPENETCGTAAPLLPGEQVRGSLAGTAPDVASRCGVGGGDLLYEFTLEDSQDVRLFATTLDGYGVPSVSLRTEMCARKEDEIACRDGDNAEFLWRSVPAGRYFVSVSASGPTDFDLRLSTRAPTPAPDDDTCDAPRSLEVGRTQSVDLSGHTDRIRFDCAPGYPDGVYELALERASDVLLVQRIAEGDSGALSLSDSDCSIDSAECVFRAVSPIRLSRRGVAAGSYRVAVESKNGASTSVTAFVRDAEPATLVAFADSCDAAIPIPRTGGFFQGNTANATARYDAGCDLGGQRQGGAPEQMLRLTLEARKRVVLDMRGSGYSTLLSVRRGPSCPGEEVAGACSAGNVPDRSYLSVVLDPGEYFVQVDGYGGASGPWFLDVFLADP